MFGGQAADPAQLGGHFETESHTFQSRNLVGTATSSATLAHEAAHRTKPPSHQNRDLGRKSLGVDCYVREELVPNWERSSSLPICSCRWRSVITHDAYIWLA